MSTSACLKLCNPNVMLSKKQHIVLKMPPHVSRLPRIELKDFEKHFVPRRWKLKQLKQMHKLQEEVLEETLKGSSLDAADEGQMPSELEALVTGEAFEGNAQKEALEREYGLVDEDHKAEVLLQKFVLPLPTGQNAPKLAQVVSYLDGV